MERIEAHLKYSALSLPPGLPKFSAQYATKPSYQQFAGGWWH
jgi:hypothetical protein